MTTYAPCPRPILKRSSTTSARQPKTPPSFPAYTPPPHPHPYHDAPSPAAVHFPPSPTLTRTFSAHSPAHYDRSPIVVAPNTCALPARGCPGRTYKLEGAVPRPPSPPSGMSASYGKHMHPRAVRRIEDDAERTPTPHPPAALLPDLVCYSSSESDESDDFASPPPEPYAYKGPRPSTPTPTSASYYARPGYDRASTTPGSLLFPDVHHDRDAEKERTKERERPRRRRRDRVVVQDDEDDATYLSINALARCTLDDGCLDGF